MLELLGLKPILLANLEPLSLQGIPVDRIYKLSIHELPGNLQTTFLDYLTVCIQYFTTIDEFRSMAAIAVPDHYRTGEAHSDAFWRTLLAYPAEDERADVLCELHHRWEACLDSVQAVISLPNPSKGVAASMPGASEDMTELFHMAMRFTFETGLVGLRNKFVVTKERYIGGGSAGDEERGCGFLGTSGRCVVYAQGGDIY
jgi:hypothetical protein